MGVSSQARNNPFRAQGLVPGVSLRVEVLIGGEVEAFATRVEDVGNERFAVLVPMQRLQQRPLPSGAVIHCEYFFRGRRGRFATETKGMSRDGQWQYLALPAGIEDADRRNYFRLPIAIRPISVYSIVLDKERIDASPGLSLNCTVVDLSEGGVCLSSRTPGIPGEWLGLHMELPQCGEVRARMRVVGNDPPAPENRNYRIHCVFADIHLSERDKIARFLMRRQLEMRRRGQL